MTTSDRKSGRAEVLTKELAMKICRFVEQMPDISIPVTWNNVVLHVKKQTGHEFRRNILSQKQWNGRKLIAEAFNEAKAIQKRMNRERAPKYGSSPRSVLQKRIADLEATVLALQEQLEAVRAAQYDALDLFRVRRMDLQQLAGAPSPKSS